MNAKVPLIAGLLALLFLSGKKGSASKKAVVPAPDIPKEDVPEDNKPAKDKPAPKALTASQKEYANMFIKNKPLVLAGPTVWASYKSWRSQKEIAKQSYLYQEWLSNQIYWYIARKEGKSDWDVQSNEFAPLPFILKKGERVNTQTYLNNVANTIVFVETQEHANDRLAQGIALWAAIYKYVMANLKECPIGAYCGGVDEKDEPIDYTLTPNEKLAADWAIQMKPYWDVNTEIVPAPSNKYNPNGDKVDWLTSVSYWTTYRGPNQEWVKSGKTPAPITPVDDWVKVWVRLNKYIASKLV